MLNRREKVSLLLIASILPLKFVFLLFYLQMIFWVLIPNLIFDWNIVYAFVIGKVMYYELAFWVKNNKTAFDEIYKD